ncbi:hypothetical protein KUCAC02_037070 [Chaenocephalus aceratus]|nr:hypothetical protein KUCAC02_037070 [Chaenocephalus aceratus]
MYFNSKRGGNGEKERRKRHKQSSGRGASFSDVLQSRSKRDKEKLSGRHGETVCNRTAFPLLGNVGKGSKGCEEREVISTLRSVSGEEGIVE